MPHRYMGAAEVHEAPRQCRSSFMSGDRTCHLRYLFLSSQFQTDPDDDQPDEVVVSHILAEGWGLS